MRCPRFGSVLWTLTSGSRCWTDGSLRFIRLTTHARLVRNPVHFPGLAAILREGLLKVRRAGGGIRPKKSNQDHFAINRILSVELAASILEFADLRRVQNANLAVGPIQPPLVGLRIVQPHGQTFDMSASRAVRFELLDLSAPVPNLSGDRSAVKFDPASRAR